MSNRLSREFSPYLLQHKDNPVDWYPWGAEAFSRAREEDRPIFLSIGYSTCHWCHVMERESFENPDVAARLNREFVSIKVDREERPDIDRVYMTFVQATTGSGGWPMSVWLTPTLEPFYGGTYFPPDSRWGRPGFLDVLQEIARAWREERDKVTGSALAIVERLRALGSSSAGGTVPPPEALEEVVAQFGASYDRTHGGFGGGPKFPRPSELLFLLREHSRTGSSESLEMVAQTLRGITQGGVRDHLGGGFHRYAVDGGWRVPHFEKMLYDQAQLVLALLEVGQASGDATFATLATETMTYVLRDLRHPDGGFMSAEDADSVPPGLASASAEKREGAFYVWAEEEVRQVLGGDADVFSARYGMLPQGNAPSDPQGEFTGQNILYEARSIDEVSRLTHHASDEVEAMLSRAKTTLLRHRTTRPRPHLDDKVLTAWNGLMIGSLARAARSVPGGDRYIRAASEAAGFFRERMWQRETSTLFRRFRQGDTSVAGYAEDYAFLIFGLLELFQSTGDASWLTWAMELQRRQETLFWDTDQGGWFSTTGEDESVLLRLKEDHDGAEPSAASVTVWNLLVLSQLFADRHYAELLEATLAGAAAAIPDQGRGAPMMAAALSLYHGARGQLVLVGDPDAPDMAALTAVVRTRYLPGVVMVPMAPALRSEVARVLPWTGRLEPRQGQATAYLCREFACELPVTSPEALAEQLSGLEV